MLLVRTERLWLSSASQTLSTRRMFLSKGTIYHKGSFTRLDVGSNFISLFQQDSGSFLSVWTVNFPNKTCVRSAERVWTTCYDKSWSIAEKVEEYLGSQKRTESERLEHKKAFFRFKAVRSLQEIETLERQSPLLYYGIAI